MSLLLETFFLSPQCLSAAHMVASLSAYGRLRSIPTLLSNFSRMFSVNVPAAVIVTLEIILFRWYNARSHICLQHSVIQVFKQALCRSASKAKNSSQKQTPSNQTPPLAASSLWASILLTIFALALLISVDKIDLIHGNKFKSLALRLLWQYRLNLSCME